MITARVESWCNKPSNIYLMYLIAKVLLIRSIRQCLWPSNKVHGERPYKIAQMPNGAGTIVRLNIPILPSGVSNLPKDLFADHEQATSYNMPRLTPHGSKKRSETVNGAFAVVEHLQKLYSRYCPYPW